MATEKITKRTVDTAKSGKRDVFIWDTDTGGFGLKITPAGRKVYVLQYRYRGQLRRYTIGRHGAPWSPEKARVEAVGLLGQVSAGIDPAQKKREAREDPTMAELCDLYLAEGCTANKASTIATDRRILERHVKPLLGQRKSKSIVRADIERAQRDVAGSKTARDEKTGFRGRSIVRGGKGIANRMVDVVASMFEATTRRAASRSTPLRSARGS
jgi:hypothetical protein